MISARAALSPIRHCLLRVNTDPILRLEVDRFEPAPALRTHAKGISTPRCHSPPGTGDTHPVPAVRRHRRRQSGLVTATSLTPSRRRSGKGPNICRLAAGSAVELRKRPRHASVSPDVVAVSEGTLRPLHALGGDAQTTSPTPSNESETNGDSEEPFGLGVRLVRSRSARGAAKRRGFLKACARTSPLVQSDPDTSSEHVERKLTLQNPGSWAQSPPLPVSIWMSIVPACGRLPLLRDAR
ncbi:hypothetical protein HPB47_010757 [Ixodes persulcatus]|uniref:Uncharacterized protein n=1 Tax=Ixodes persulcatus TaxID=34615 RepID=A0AC60NY76_IXOPE|nr:hypothetical protein HPB47_010757 [Ixodes persulcatus]